MTDTTPNLALPELIAAQAQKHVTVNEALRALDALVQLAVLDRDLTAPPGSPAEGQRWLIAATATGAWASHDHQIAAWQDGGWEYYAPKEGWLAYVVDEGTLLAWHSGGWVDAITAITSLNNLVLLGVGTTADTTNPFSAKLNNALWTAKSVAEGGDGDLRYKLNKETASDTLSMLLQTAYSGRAELGLTGDDDFHLKVSADGSAWKEALGVDRASGGVRFLANSCDVASAATCDIGLAAGLKVRITGTATITSFGSVAHAFRLIRFADALTLTHNATSLILPGAANILTATDDSCLAVSDSSGNWRVLAYQRSSGVPLKLMSGETDVASASTCDIGAANSVRVRITGTTTITGLGSRPDTIRFVRFDASLTLTFNATSLITQSGFDRRTAAGDFGVYASDTSGNWRELAYVPASNTPGKNIVDNPVFVNWQRGTSFSVASGTKTAVADRWKVYRNATGLTISRQVGFSGAKYCMRVARDSSNSSTSTIRIFHQLHEDVARGLAGRTVTLSFDVRAGADYSGGALAVAIHTGTGGSEAADLSSSSAAVFATGGAFTAVSTNVTPTTTAQRVNCTPLALGATIADLAFRINWAPTGTAAAANYFEITNVKLEAGPLATPFVAPSEADDLLACSYTFRKLGIGSIGAVQSATTVQLGAILQPPMRVAPAVALLSDYSLTIGAASKTSSGGAIAASTLQPEGVAVTTNGFSALTAGQAGAVTTQYALSLDAELV
jgi:hypothetical protein